MAKILVSVDFNGTVILKGQEEQHICLDRDEACEHGILITTNTGAVVQFICKPHKCDTESPRYVWRAKMLTPKEKIKIIECDPCEYEDSDWVEFFGTFTCIAASVPLDVQG